MIKGHLMHCMQSGLCQRLLVVVARIHAKIQTGCKRFRAFDTCAILGANNSMRRYLTSPKTKVQRAQRHLTDHVHLEVIFRHAKCLSLYLFRLCQHQKRIWDMRTTVVSVEPSDIFQRLQTTKQVLLFACTNAVETSATFHAKRLQNNVILWQTVLCLFNLPVLVLRAQIVTDRNQKSCLHKLRFKDRHNYILYSIS